MSWILLHPSPFIHKHILSKISLWFLLNQLLTLPPPSSNMTKKPPYIHYHDLFVALKIWHMSSSLLSVVLRTSVSNQKHETTPLNSASGFSLKKGNYLKQSYIESLIILQVLLFTFTENSKVNKLNDFKVTKKRPENLEACWKELVA